MFKFINPPTNAQHDHGRFSGRPTPTRFFGTNGKVVLKSRGTRISRALAWTRKRTLISSHKTIDLAGTLSQALTCPVCFLDNPMPLPTPMERLQTRPCKKAQSKYVEGRFATTCSRPSPMPARWTSIRCGWARAAQGAAKGHKPGSKVQHPGQGLAARPGVERQAGTVAQGPPAAGDFSPWLTCSPVGLSWLTDQLSANASTKRDLSPGGPTRLTLPAPDGATRLLKSFSTARATPKVERGRRRF